MNKEAASNRVQAYVDVLLHDLDVDEVVLRQIVDRMTTLVEEAVARERSRCVSLCRDRGETWRRTPLAAMAGTYASEEARARANEAVYLADLLEMP